MGWIQIYLVNLMNSILSYGAGIKFAAQIVLETLYFSCLNVIVNTFWFNRWILMDYSHRQDPMRSVFQESVTHTRGHMQYFHIICSISTHKFYLGEWPFTPFGWGISNYIRPLLAIHLWKCDSSISYLALLLPSARAKKRVIGCISVPTLKRWT